MLLSQLDGMVYRCYIDEHWTMDFASAGCLALTGHAPADLLSNRKLSWEMLTHPDDRQRVRALFGPSQFVEIFLSTSVQECARRDPKGLYAKARAGHITGLTGWDGPYECPTHPEYEFDTEIFSTEQMVQKLLGS